MKAFDRIEHINQFFTKDFGFGRQVSIFRKAIYIYLFINTIICLFDYSYLWGAHHFVAEQSRYPYWHPGILGHILRVPILKDAAWVLIIIQLFSLTVGYFGKYRRLTSFLVWWTTFNLFNPIHLGVTGGEVILHLLLFYMIFIHENRKDALNTLLNNTFFWACRWQIIVVYIFAAWYKLYDETWLNGEALYYILQIDAFSRPLLSDLISEQKTLLQIGTYFVLLYQLAFPFLIWWKKIKTPFLIVGVLFHISIAFVTGVFSFGIIMILVYILWFDYGKKRATAL